jgi:hypothetical protein
VNKSTGLSSSRMGAQIPPHSIRLLERLYREEHLAVRRLKRKRLLRPAAPMTEVVFIRCNYAPLKVN